ALVSEIAAIPQTPLPDRTSWHAPRWPHSARPTILIAPEPPASLRTRPASSRADRETRNRRRAPPPPIDGGLSRPRPSRSGTCLQSPTISSSPQSIRPLLWTTRRSTPSAHRGSALQCPPHPSPHTNRATWTRPAQLDRPRIAR